MHPQTAIIISGFSSWAFLRIPTFPKTRFSAFSLIAHVLSKTISASSKILVFVKRIIHAFFSENDANSCMHFFRTLHSSFEDFIYGQCLECFLVAAIFTISAGIMGFKCAIVVGIIMFFLAFIPYVGNFVSCGIGVLLTLAMESPVRAIIICVLYEYFYIPFSISQYFSATSFYLCNVLCYLDSLNKAYHSTYQAEELLKDLPVYSVPVLSGGKFKTMDEIISYLGNSHYITDKHLENLNLDIERMTREELKELERLEKMDKKNSQEEDI